MSRIGLAVCVMEANFTVATYWCGSIKNITINQLVHGVRFTYDDSRGMIAEVMITDMKAFNVQFNNIFSNVAGARYSVHDIRNLKTIMRQDLENMHIITDIQVVLYNRMNGKFYTGLVNSDSPLVPMEKYHELS